MSNWVPWRATALRPGDIYSHDEDGDEAWLCLTHIDGVVVCLPLGKEWEWTNFTIGESDLFIWLGEGLPK